MGLWLGASHAIDGLSRMPMLLLTSTVPECGKTTAGTLVSRLESCPAYGLRALRRLCCSD